MAVMKVGAAGIETISGAARSAGRQEDHDRVVLVRRRPSV